MVQVFFPYIPATPNEPSQILPTSHPYNLSEITNSVHSVSMAPATINRRSRRSGRPHRLLLACLETSTEAIDCDAARAIGLAFRSGRSGPV
jgi:hypothetical protein